MTTVDVIGTINAELAKLDAAFEAAWRRSVRFSPLGNPLLRQALTAARYRAKVAMDHDRTVTAQTALAAVAEAIAVFEAYAAADDPILLGAQHRRTVDVRKEVAAAKNPCPPASPPPFSAGAWIKGRRAAGWDFRLQHGLVMVKAPAKPMSATLLATELAAMKKTIAAHSAAIIEALKTDDLPAEQGFEVVS